MVPLLSLGRQNGIFYLVTPHQDGTDLRAVLQAGGLDAADVLTIARCLLDV